MIHEKFVEIAEKPVTNGIKDPAVTSIYNRFVKSLEGDGLWGYGTILLADATDASRLKILQTKLTSKFQITFKPLSDGSFEIVINFNSRNNTCFHDVTNMLIELNIIEPAAQKQLLINAAECVYHLIDDSTSLLKGAFHSIKTEGLNPTNIYELNLVKSKASGRAKVAVDTFVDYFKEAIEACQEQKLSINVTGSSFSP